MGRVKAIGTLKKATAPNAVMVADGRELIHTIQDATFPTIKIYKRRGRGRRGFWETDTAKIDKLINAFKAGHNTKNACFYAGISLDSYEDFVRAYPEFSGAKEACESFLTFNAMETVTAGLKKDPQLAYKYIHQRGDFNFPTRKVEDDKPLQPTVNVAVQVNNNLTDESTIEKRLRERRAQRLSERSGEGNRGSNEAMAGVV